MIKTVRHIVPILYWMYYIVVLYSFIGNGLVILKTFSLPKNLSEYFVMRN